MDRPSGQQQESAEKLVSSAVVLDEVCSSSTSSTMTECSEGRPVSAGSLSLANEPSSVASVSLKRGPGRPKKDDTEPRKPHSQRTKTKKAHKEAKPDIADLSCNILEVPLRDAGGPSVSSIKQEPVSVCQITNVGLPMGKELPPLTSAGLTAIVIKREPGSDVHCVVAESCDSVSRSSLPAGTEDSGASEEASSSGVPEKTCALCNRGERSLLGQGELKCYEPTSGFNPFKRQLTRAGAKRALSDADDTIGRSQQHLTWRRTRGPIKQQSLDKSMSTQPPYRSNSQPALEFDAHSLPQSVDELKLVGYPDDVDVTQLFEKSGHVRAHHCCAAWSEGVIQAEDYSLRYVDKAVFAGLNQKCNYCMNYGATINCRFARCTKKYHYPCASGSGCFQDIKTMSLLCPDHIEEAVTIANQEAYCVVCDSPGNISDQLFCTSCGQHYHGNCLDPAVEVNPVVRAGWQCPECKICQTCRQPGDDNKMLVCDTCDKGYHTFCLRPVMTTIPKNGWKCKNCRVCGDCGSRTPGSGPSSRWHLNYSVCDSCYQQRNKGACCPLCGKAYRHFTQSTMLLCTQCKRHVHAECDDSIDQYRNKPEEYVCHACKNSDVAPVFDTNSMTDSLPSVIDDNGLQDIENFGIFKGLKEGEDMSSNQDHDEADEAMHSSQESLVVTEESISSMDIDLNALDKVDQQLANASPEPVDCSADMPLVSTSGNSGSMRDGLPSKDSSIQSSINIRASRPGAGGIGKPIFCDDGVGKKGAAGRQRGRTAGVGKKKRQASHSSENKRGAKPKLKQLHSSGQQPGGSNSQDQNGKDDDHQQTIVLCSTRDHFTLKQDMCLTCGSYGVGEEGRLIACVQCGQCYHPYCANIKISKIMLQKGWRCLDCTVCEGCGKPHDESRLILCDECDISYHIYCLDPPLDSVPTGTWKCKWCILCVTCGATTPGPGTCQWQNNYSQCGPCASLEACPVCCINYSEGDLIIECAHCTRWIHATCDGIANDEEAERAVDYGYHCLMCRPTTGLPGPLPPVSPERPVTPVAPREPTPPPVSAVIKEPELPKTPKTFFLDGVCLSETGLSQIRGLSMKLVEKKQRPRWRRTPTHPALVQMMLEKSEEDMETSDMKTNPIDINLDGDDNKPEVADWDILSPPLERQSSENAVTGLQGLEKKKKARIRVGMGIGGFMPRHRTRGGGQMRGGRTVVTSGKPGIGSAEVANVDQDDDGDVKKLKQRRKVIKKVIKKSHMEDNYPLYLQDAFFGRDLLDKCKDSQVGDVDLVSEDDKEVSTGNAGYGPSAKQTKQYLALPATTTKTDVAVPIEAMDTADYSRSSLVPAGQTAVATSGQHAAALPWASDTKQRFDNLDGLDPDAAAGDDLDKDHNFDETDLEGVLPREPLDDLMNLPWEDIAHTEEDPPDLNEHLGEDGGRTSDEHISGLEAMLNPNQELALIDNETLEVFLKNGLSSDNQPETTNPNSQSGGNFSLQAAGGFMDKTSRREDNLFSRQDTGTPSSSISPFSPSLTADDFPGLGFNDPNLWPANAPATGSAPATAGQFGSAEFRELPLTAVSSLMVGAIDDGDTNENLSFNQRNVKKWEVDEPLGDMATISPVLYCNLRHPELKIQYPEWSERAKQIAKLWRKVPTEQRAPYLAKARDNRASVRMQKSQKDARRRPRDAAAGALLTTQTSVGSSPAPDLNRQPSVDQSESSNQSAVHTSSDDKGKLESDVYTFPPHTPQTPPNQSSCGYVQPHHLVFKQPHPPPVGMAGGAQYDQCGHPLTPGSTQLMTSGTAHPLTPGVCRSNPELMASHQLTVHSQPHTPTSNVVGSDVYSQSAPGTPVATTPDQFSHQQIFRPTSGSPVAGPLRPSPPGGDNSVRHFAVPFHSPSSGTTRFVDPYCGHGTKPLTELPPSGGPGSESHYAMMPGPGTHEQHPEGYPQYSMNRSPADQYVRPGMYAVPAGAMPDTYMRMHLNPRAAVGQDTYGRLPMPHDANLRMPGTPKAMPAEHYPNMGQRDPYAHAPMTPGPSDPYARPPMTPSPVDPYARPPMTPAPVDPYTRPPMTPGPADPYARPPMTPRPVSSDAFASSPSSDPYARPPMTPRPHAPLTPSQCDIYARPPMTPRPLQPDAVQPAQIRPGAANPMDSSYAAQVGNRPGQVGESPEAQKQLVSRPGFAGNELQQSPPKLASHTPLYEYNYRLWQYGPQSSGSCTLDDEQLARQQFQSDMQRQQLRELLAKQTKQRQSKKKQDQKDVVASSSGSQLPLRHWPDDSTAKSGLMVGDGVTKPTIPGNVAESEEQGLRQAVHMVHPGDGEMFTRVLPTSDIIRQPFPSGPAVRQGVVRGLSLPASHPGMPSPQFAMQHRPVYAEMPRHELMTDQSAPPGMGGQLSHRTPVPGPDGMPGFHPRGLVVTQKPISSPRLPAGVSGTFEGSLPGSRMAVLTDTVPHQLPPGQHQRMMIQQQPGGGWFGGPEIVYRPNPGGRIRGPMMPPPGHQSARLMYQPLQMCGQLPGQQQQQIPQEHLEVLNAAVLPTGSNPLGIDQQAPVGQLPRVGTDDAVDKSDGDQFEDLIGAGDNFDILEYADPELNKALSENNDRTIFDEHLGLNQSSNSSAMSIASASSAISIQSTASVQVTAGQAGLTMSMTTPPSATPSTSVSVTVGTLPGLPSVASEASAAPLPPQHLSNAAQSLSQVLVPLSPAVNVNATVSSAQGPVGVSAQQISSSISQDSVVPSSSAAPAISVSKMMVSGMPATLVSEGQGHKVPLASSDDSPKTDSKLSSTDAVAKHATGTDFQAKFLEFSQRKVAGSVSSITVCDEHSDAAGVSGGSKSKKAEISAVTFTKKPSPAHNDEVVQCAGQTTSASSATSVSDTKAEIESSSSLPPQVDGCYDDSSCDESSYCDEKYFNSDDDDVDLNCACNASLQRSNVDSILNDLDVNMSDSDCDNPELVDIWGQSLQVLPQVDGTADNKTDENEKDSNQAVADVSQGHMEGESMETETSVVPIPAESSASEPTCQMDMDSEQATSGQKFVTTDSSSATSTNCSIQEELIQSSVPVHLPCGDSTRLDSEVISSKELIVTVENTIVPVGEASSSIPDTIVTPVSQSSSTVANTSEADADPSLTKEQQSTAGEQSLADVDSLSVQLPTVAVPENAACNREVVESVEVKAAGDKSVCTVGGQQPLFMENMAQADNALVTSVMVTAVNTAVALPAVDSQAAMLTSARVGDEQVSGSSNDAVLSEPHAQGTEPAAEIQQTEVAALPPSNQTHASPLEGQEIPGAVSTSNVVLAMQNTAPPVCQQNLSSSSESLAANVHVVASSAVEMVVSSMSVGGPAVSSVDITRAQVPAQILLTTSVTVASSAVDVNSSGQIPNQSFAPNADHAVVRMEMSTHGQLPVYRGSAPPHSAGGVPRQMYIVHDVGAARHPMMPYSMPASEVVHTGQPPPPYPNKQFAGPGVGPGGPQQQFWQHHQMRGGSGPPPREWIRPSHLVHTGAPREWIRHPVGPPPQEWSSHSQPHQDWQQHYVVQTPQHSVQQQQMPQMQQQQMPSDWGCQGSVPSGFVAGHDLNHPSYQQHTPLTPSGQMHSPAYQHGSQPVHSPAYQQFSSQPAHSPAYQHANQPVQSPVYQHGSQPVHSPASMHSVVDGSGIGHPRTSPSLRPLPSPQQSSPVPSRLEHHDMASPRSAHSRTPHNLSQPGTPQTLQPGTSMSVHAVSESLQSSLQQSPLPAAGSIASEAAAAAAVAPASSSAESTAQAPPPSVSSENVLSQQIAPDSCQQVVYSVVSSTDNQVNYGISGQATGHPPGAVMHRVYVPASAGGRYFGPPPPPHSMYLPLRHPPGTGGGPPMFRVPSSSSSAHSTIGALLNQHRPAVPPGVHVQYMQRTGPGEQRYQLIPASSDGYSHMPPRARFQALPPGALMMQGGPAPTGSGVGPPRHGQLLSQGHQDTGGGFAVMPSSVSPQLQAQNVVPVQVGPRAGSPHSTVMMRQVPPPGAVRFGSRMMVMVPNTELHQQQQPHGEQMFMPGYHDPSGIYRTKLTGEQPLLLEDLLEQEKQEQRRQAEQQQIQSQQQLMSGQANQPLTGQPGSQSGNSAMVADSTPGVSDSASNATSVVGSSVTTSVVTATVSSVSITDTSAILTDDDVDKLNVDVMSEEFRQHLPMGATLPYETDTTQIQQQSQQTTPYEHQIQQMPAGPSGWMPQDVASLPGGLMPPRPVGPRQMSPRTTMLPQQFLSGPSAGATAIMYGPQLTVPPAGSIVTTDLVTGVPFTGPAPIKPPDPISGEAQTEEDIQARLKYEAWIQQTESWLLTNIQTLEQQVNKYRKTKKALSAKQRVARKNGNELSEMDQQTLSVTCQEQSGLQKQLDQLRKQHRSHRNLMNDYQTKQPSVSFSQRYDVTQWSAATEAVAQQQQQSAFGHQQPPGNVAPAVAAAVGVMPPSAMTVKSPGNNPGLARAPGAVQPVRLTQAARQEYEEYVQSRLRAANQQPGPRLPVAQLAAMGGPPGTGQGLSQTAIHTIITQGDENNPFSESFQQRERMEKLRIQEHQRFQLQQQMEHQQDRASAAAAAVATGVVFDKQGQPQMLRPTLHTDVSHRYPGPAHPGGQPMVFTADGMPVTHTDGGTILRHSVPLTPSTSIIGPAIGTPTGPVCTTLITASDPRLQDSSAVSLHQMPPGIADSAEGHHHANIPGQNATDGEISGVTPKKKRRRRKKAELLAGEAASALPSGVMMARENDLELNQSLIIPQFPTTAHSGGHNLSLGVPAGGLRLVRPDGMPQFSKVADGGLEKIPSSFSPTSRPGAIRPPPCPSQVLPIQGQGVIQIPVEGRGTTDLQLFVNRVRPAQQFLAPGETGGPTVPQQHFSPGSQKQATYVTTAEQPLSQFSIQPDVIMKTDPHVELGEQATAIGDNTDKSGRVADEDGKTLSSNVILKTLLNTGKPADQSSQLFLSGTSGPVCRLSEDEENIQLTPEQQRQLEMIENMPLAVAKEQDDDLQSSEDRENIIEIRRQEFERRRKELAEQQPKVSRPRQRRTVKQEAASSTTSSTAASLPAAAGSDSGERTPTKKRQKKSHPATPLANISGNTTPLVGDTGVSPAFACKPADSRMSSGVDYGAMAEQILHQLQQLPVVSLQEPEVRINYTVWPVLGTSVYCDGNTNSTTALKGNFGNGVIQDVVDYYNSPPFFSPLPVLPESKLTKSPQVTIDSADVQATSTRNAATSQTKAVVIEQEVTVPVQTKGPAVTNHGLSLVTSILNDQQSRPGSMASERIKMPSPPLIGPHYEALSRMSDQSPATVITSSSPELNEDSYAEPDVPWKHLMTIKQEAGRKSPEVPVIRPKPVKATKAFDADVDDERSSNNKGNIKSFNIDMNGGSFKPPVPSSSEQDSNQVSVMLTLSANAAENIGGVIAAIADLLRIAVPASYEISRSPSPPPYAPASSAEFYRFGFSSGGKHKEEAINIQSLMQSKSKFCHVCSDVVTDASRLVKSDFHRSSISDQMLSDDELGEIVFCSENCRKQFHVTGNAMQSSGVKASESTLAASSATEATELPPPDKMTILAPESVEGDVEMTSVCTKMEVLPSSDDMATSKDTSVSVLSAISQPLKPLKLSISIGPQSSAVTIVSSGVTPGSKSKKLLKHKASVDSLEEDKTAAKRFKEVRHKHWAPSMMKQEKQVKAATEGELTEILDRLTPVVRPKTRLKDTRTCVLCHIVGDAPTNGPGRLLNMDADKWVHLNCALWSSEVYETMNGALMYVDGAYKRSLTTLCVRCNQAGATVGCYRPRCTNVYHVTCAQLENVTFYEDKSVLCALHTVKSPDLDGQLLTSIAVFRRVYINRDENIQVARIIRNEDRKHAVRVGGLVLHNVGQLLPYQIHCGFFNTTDCIYPVGYKAIRYYWSYRQINKRCRYICKIEDDGGRPSFVVDVIERGMEQTVLKESSCQAITRHILEPLEKMRRENDMVKIFPSFFSAEDLFGLTEPTVQKIIESLPGIEMLSNYSFRYGRSSIYKLPLAVNPTGCTRSEPRLRTHFKKPYTLHGASNCRTIPSTVTVVPGDVNSPYLKQFVHSKSQQYRRLKTEWRNNVYLRRSNVQGLGLFAARDLEKHTMVIEYIGQLIRNEVAEKREKDYDKQNHGVYMFRISDNMVVDATMTGGLARYINHSCHPNCVAEVVQFEKDSKIIIFTKRKISQGEELSYDYKFDYEDDQHKIPCLCGAQNCRKWMN